MDINQEIQISLQMDFLFNNEKSPPDSEDGDDLKLNNKYWMHCLHDYSYKQETDALK